MAYFNHAFEKAFLGTGATRSSVAVSLLDGTTVSTSTNLGYVTTDGVPTYGLNQLKASAASEYANGYFGIFNPKTNLTFTPTNCCSAYLAGSAIYDNDKIGPLAGGYQETNKSKLINPRYVSHFYGVAPCSPQNNVIHVGSTYWTAGGGVLTVDTLVGGGGYSAGIAAVSGGTGSGMIVSFTVTGDAVSGVTIINPGKGYTVNDTLTILSGDEDATFDVATVTESHAQVGCGTTADCCKEFLCGETYSLRLDVKGSPALRFLNHNAYATVDAYTGCCPEGAIAPVAVDSTTVMIAWANAIVNNPIVSPFIQPVVQAEDGTLWYAPGTAASFLTANDADTWDNYVAQAHVAGECAGLILNGAYVDTRFGDCTFQLSDFYEKEPVKLYASEVDYNGDPCAFETLCVVTECEGLQVQGLGETVLRELVLSESYRQNFLATDLRIREITQGNQMVGAIDRGALYYRYVLIHNVPRFNNPSGVFDNDQYALTIFSTAAMSTFVTDITNWLEGCGSDCIIEDPVAFSCNTACDVPVNFPDLPLYNPYNVVSCN
jgi:hypothetical protein